MYGTAGWAIAGVHNTHTSAYNGYSSDDTNTKSGFVWGGGVERMFAPNWSARVEALAVDLGNSTVATVVPKLNTYVTRFSNKVVVARGGVSFAW